MATIYRSTALDVSPEVAWSVIDRYTRAEVHVFSSCVAERLEDDCRVVTLEDGTEIWERNITVDPEHRRAVYTVPAVPGTEHHQAEMRIDVDGAGRAVLVWTTDVLPHEVADFMQETYDGLWVDLVARVNEG